MNPDGTPDSTGAFASLLGLVGQGVTAYGQAKAQIDASKTPAATAAATAAAKAAPTNGPLGLSPQQMLIAGGLAAVALWIALRK